MADHKQPKTLVEEKLAVSLFLESLLQEPAEELSLQQETELEPSQAVQLTSETSEETEVVVQAAVDAKPDNNSIQVLIFKVSGLKLAVPLTELSGVIEWQEDRVTEMPGHADFYLGLLQHQGYKVPVIDTASMVFPASKLHELAGKNPRERVRHIILIDNYQWGLACDEVDDVLTLQTSDIHWRKRGGKRPWLAGTVVEQMCALLNCASFSDMLRTGNKDV